MKIHSTLITRLYLTLGLFWITWLFLLLGWWTYPISQVSKPECKKYTWDEMSSDCKMDLPIIDVNNLEKHDTDINRYIYSDLWWATYKWWRDVMSWSSPGIDIATSNWTPVYAIWDWEVIIAKKWWDFGNTVTIKHKYNNGYIYSSYSHLESMDIKVWDTVKEWQLIWKVWRSWYVIWQFWNHLDFQITTKTSKENYYPYSFNGCTEWWEYHEKINAWACRDKIFEYTADPIAFLNSNGAKLRNTDLNKTVSKNEEKDIHAAASNVSKANVYVEAKSLKLEGDNTKVADTKVAATTTKTTTSTNSTTKNTTTTTAKVATTTTKTTTTSNKVAVNNIKKNETAKLWWVYKFWIQTETKNELSKIKVVDTQWLLKIGKSDDKNKTSANIYIKPIKKWTTTIKVMHWDKVVASYNIKIS